MNSKKIKMQKWKQLRKYKHWSANKQTSLASATFNKWNYQRATKRLEEKGRIEKKSN